MRLRALGALTLSIAVAGAIVPLATAQAGTVSAPHDTSAVGTAATEFYFASAAGDYIGKGATVDYTDPTVSIAADLSSLGVSAGGALGWDLTLAAPTGQVLTAGTTYTGALGSATADAAGLSVDGDGRGCDNDYGSFTITEISATSLNATFTQTCESLTAPPLVGFIRYNATTPTTVPTLTSSAQPITDPADSGSTAADAGNEFSFLSATGDSIGAGSPADYTGSSVTASGTLGNVTVSAGPWELNLAAPADEQLVPGTYVGATRYPYNTGGAPGITVSGDGRACNNDYGTFTIYQIASDSTGALTQLNATYSQTCESLTAPPLVGFIRYNATTPTPIPTLPVVVTPTPTPTATAAATPLVAALAVTTGASLSNGETEVTLDASASTGTDSSAGYQFDFNDGTAVPVATTPVITMPKYEGTYEVTVTITDGNQSATSTPQWVTIGDGYHAVTPQRVLDTRYGTGGTTGPVKANGKVTLKLPASITSSGHGTLRAVVLNLTVTSPTAIGDVAAYSTGLSQNPTTSNLNYSKGETVANLVTVPVVAGGSVVLSVSSAGTEQLIADLEGYYTAGDDATNAGYGAVTPTRILDTRHDTGGAGGRVAGGKTIKLTLPSSVPAGTTAIVLNVTAVAPSTAGFVSVFPDGASTNASNLNFPGKTNVPNLVIVSVPADRTIDFKLGGSGSSDILADFDGYFSASAASKFVPSFPERMFDTRKEGPAIPGYDFLPVPMAYLLQVPTTALTAALYNVTVTQPTTPGYVSVVPDPITTAPTVSNLNFATDETVANAVLAPMTNGSQDFFNGSPSGTIQLISDFFGYFAKPLTTTAPPASDSVAAAAARSSATAQTAPLFALRSAQVNALR